MDRKINAKPPLVEAGHGDLREIGTLRSVARAAQAVIRRHGSHSPEWDASEETDHGKETRVLCGAGVVRTPRAEVDMALRREGAGAAVASLGLGGGAMSDVRQHDVAAARGRLGGQGGAP